MGLDPLWQIGLLEPGQEGGAIGLGGLNDGVDEEGNESVGRRVEHPDLGFFPKVLSKQVARALCEEEFDGRYLRYFKGLVEGWRSRRRGEELGEKGEWLSSRHE